MLTKCLTLRERLYREKINDLSLRSYCHFGKDKVRVMEGFSPV